MDIETLMKRVHQTAREHGWWDNPGKDTNIPEKLALIHSEISEALEEYRGSKPVFYHSPEDLSLHPKPEGLAVELADAIIRILDLCAALDLPIVEALERKCEYNETRPYRHGGKRC